MSAASILENLAVARRSASEAATIFGAYATTKGLQMAQSYNAESEPAPQAAASAPAGPGGGSASRPAQGQRAAAIVADHEVFKNDKDAIAFFFYHHPTLDRTSEEGPFWFTVQDGKRIIAGTKEAYAILDGLNPDVVESAKNRGVIMLVEFENQQPYRCTPCYLADSL